MGKSRLAHQTSSVLMMGLVYNMFLEESGVRLIRGELRSEADKLHGTRNTGWWEGFWLYALFIHRLHTA